MCSLHNAPIKTQRGIRPHSNRRLQSLLHAQVASPPISKSPTEKTADAAAAAAVVSSPVVDRVCDFHVEAHVIAVRLFARQASRLVEAMQARQPARARQALKLSKGFWPAVRVHVRTQERRVAVTRAILVLFLLILAAPQAAATPAEACRRRQPGEKSVARERRKGMVASNLYELPHSDPW